MTAALLGILTTYVALAVLLLGLCLYSKWPLWVKGGAIVASSLFYYATYLSLGNLMGWPTPSDLPQDFILLAAQVEEPDDRVKSSGAIYLWALPLNGERSDAMPRAYTVPYSKLLHNQVSEANKKLRRGVPQVGKSENRVVHKPGMAATWFEERTQRVIIHDLPDPELPDK